MHKLSDFEAQLYERVTNYVRDEFNRADALEVEGRKGTVGFALTTADVSRNSDRAVLKHHPSERGLSSDPSCQQIVARKGQRDQERTDPFDGGIHSVNNIGKLGTMGVA